jgi:hypothetical protein
MVEDLKFAFIRWQENTEKAMEAAGTSVKDFNEDINEVVRGEDGIVETSDEVITRIESIASAMEDAFGENAMDAFAAFAESYISSLNPMIEETERLIGDLNDLIFLEAEMDKNSNPTEEE